MRAPFEFTSGHCELDIRIFELAFGSWHLELDVFVFVGFINIVEKKVKGELQLFV